MEEEFKRLIDDGIIKVLLIKNSSNIEKIWYRADKKEMHVHFKTYGKKKPSVYRYSDVNEDVFIDFVNSSKKKDVSIGKKFNKEIQKAYVGKKVNTEKKIPKKLTIPKKVVVPKK